MRCRSTNNAVLPDDGVYSQSNETAALPRKIAVPYSPDYEVPIMVPFSNDTLLLVPTEVERRVLVAEVGPQWANRWQLSGFGQIVAAARTAQLIASNRPRRVLLAGIGGGLSAAIEVGKAYAFSQVACYGVGFGSGTQFQCASEMGWDQWPSIGGTSTNDDDNNGDRIGDVIDLTIPGRLSNTDERGKPGLLLSVTSAAASADDLDHRLTLFPFAVAEDMEAFGVAVACRLSGVPLVVIRGISNRAGDRNKNNWQIGQALRSTAALVSVVLSEPLDKES